MISISPKAQQANSRSFSRDDENRTYRRTRYVFRRAANSEIFPTGEAVRADHDQVGTEVVGYLNDLIGGGACSDA
jgi:hypothetical protein